MIDADECCCFTRVNERLTVAQLRSVDGNNFCGVNQRCKTRGIICDYQAMKVIGINAASSNLKANAVNHDTTGEAAVGRCKYARSASYWVQQGLTFVILENVTTFERLNQIIPQLQSMLN